MSVSFWVDDNRREIGSTSFLRAFLSTISHHLEPDGWGSKYPEIMQDLFQEGISFDKVDKVYNDVIEIREELKRFKPAQIVWNIEDLDERPPWGDNISKHITDLSNYFVTSDGRDLITVFLESLQDLKAKGGMLTIE